MQQGGVATKERRVRRERREGEKERGKNLPGGFPTSLISCSTGRTMPIPSKAPARRPRHKGKLLKSKYYGRGGRKEREGGEGERSEKIVDNALGGKREGEGRGEWEKRKP